MSKTKLYDTDYVLFRGNKPVEPLDIIYAEESVKELFEDGFQLEAGEQFIKMTELPIEWQKKYIAEIERLSLIHKIL
tara:strand:+ start:220 stop:450 length:231 start_codon:yes stop_codon:yes gene_type:complete